MAMVAVPVPHDVGRLFRTVDISDERDPSDHITMFYLGDDVPLSTIIKVMPLLYDITSKTDPFLATCKKITTFPKGDNGWPVIAPVDSPQLLDIRKRLQRVFDRKGIDYSDKHPDYKPHVTLGYSAKKIKNVKLKKQLRGIENITKDGLKFKQNIGKLKCKPVPYFSQW